jgi:hypothetical protein
MQAWRVKNISGRYYAAGLLRANAASGNLSTTMEPRGRQGDQVSCQ